MRRISRIPLIDSADVLDLALGASTFGRVLLTCVIVLVSASACVRSTSGAGPQGVGGATVENMEINAARIAQDSEAVRFLERNGTRLRVGRATVWFPPEISTEVRRRQIATSYDSIIGVVEQLIGAPRPWQDYPKSHVTYYLAPGRFVSHATSGQQVYMPAIFAWRGTAPVIHETAHAVLAPRRAWARRLTAVGRARMRRDYPMWLEEGLASYISARLTTDTASWGGEFAPDPLAGLDRTCVVRAGAGKGRVVLPYVGAPGRPPGIQVDRARMAPPFYACSASYVKFLVDRYGLDAVAALRDKHDVPTALSKLAGRSAIEVREEWWRSLPPVDVGR